MRVEISQDTMRAIERYKQLHPEVWIKRPDQTASRRWEVSLPARAPWHSTTQQT